MTRQKSIRNEITKTKTCFKTLGGLFIMRQTILVLCNIKFIISIEKTKHLEIIEFHYNHNVLQKLFFLI